MKQLSMYECIEQPSMQGTATSASLGKPSAEAIASINPEPPQSETHQSNANERPTFVTEIIIAKERAHGFQMLLPMLTHLNQEKRWLAWVNPPAELIKSWRKDNEMHTNEIMVLRSDEQHSAMALARQALAAGTCHAVVTWTEQLGSEDFDALEQAASTGQSHGIVLRYR